MSDFTIKHQCPGAWQPMASGDGMIMRVRAPLNQFSADQLKVIAQVSMECGNGQLDITRRGTLQIRGVQDNKIDHAQQTLLRAGLLDDTLAGEQAGHILVSPFWSLWDKQAFDAVRFVQDLKRSLVERGVKLPAKFGFILDCGETPVLTQVPADIRIEYNAGRFVVVAGNHPLGRPISGKQVIATVLELVKWYLDHGGMVDNRGRMAQLLERVSLPQSFQTINRVSPVQAYGVQDVGKVEQGLLIGYAFGRLDVEAVMNLAQFDRVYLTPWRSFFIPDYDGVPDPHPAMITARDDPRLRMAVCRGKPDCTQARAATQDVAHLVAQQLERHETAHITACPKNCAGGQQDFTYTLLATEQGRYHLPNGGLYVPV